MSYTGNTPGKWEYVEELGEVWAKQDGTDDFRVCIVEASNADGTLLAASKELLAACEQALADGKEYGGNLTGDTWKLIRAAVVAAKAAP